MILLCILIIPYIFFSSYYFDSGRHLPSEVLGNLNDGGVTNDTEVSDSIKGLLLQIKGTHLYSCICSCHYQVCKSIQLAKKRD